VRRIYLEERRASANAAAALGRDDAVRSDLFANVPMVLFGVKFGIGQYQANRRGFASRIDQIR